MVQRRLARQKLLSGRSAAPRGAMSARLTQPEISPLRLDRLKKLPPPEEPQIVAAAAPGSSDAVVALGSAPLSGLRSGRFTPRATLTPRGSPRLQRSGKTPRQKRPSIDKASSSAGAPAALVPLTEEVAAPSAAAAPFTSSDAIALCEDDATLASACGELRAFYLRGPPLPPLEAPPSVAPPAGGGGATRRARRCWPHRHAPPPYHAPFGKLVHHSPTRLPPSVVAAPSAGRRTRATQSFTLLLLPRVADRAPTC